MRPEKILLIFAALLASYGLGLVTASYLEQPLQPSVILRQLPTAEKYEASVDIVAVRQTGQIGVVSKAVAEIVEGKGRVLFSLNPFVEPDTQQSAETAASVAQNFTGKSLADRDVIYSIEEIEAKLVGGPSAGAALTLATIAAIEEKQVKEEVAITGTILPDGSIGQIGGLVEKAGAVAEQGKTLFLVPEGQGTLNYYERVVEEEKRGFFTIQRVKYVPKKIDLNEFAEEQGWNLEIMEVSNISQATAIMLE